MLGQSSQLEVPEVGVATAVTAVTAGKRGEPVPSRRGPTWLLVTLIPLIALGGTLRGVYAGAYEPWVHHWDEPLNISVGEELAASTSLDPGFYDYPAMVFLVQGMILVPADKLGLWDPEDGSVLDLQSPGAAYVRDTTLFTTLRWAVGVVPSLLTIGVTSALAWILSRRWWVASLAALLMALSPLDLQFGVYVTPDSLTGLFATLALLGSVYVVKDPSRRHYALTGAAAGLAAGSKYNAGVVVLALVAAHVVRHGRLWAERQLLVRAALAAMACFAVVNIGAVLHPVELVQELGGEGLNYSNGFPDPREQSSPAFNSLWLWRTFGVGLLPAALALPLLPASRRRPVIPVVTFVAVYFVFVSAFPSHFARNLLPMTGGVAVLVAVGLHALAERLSREPRSTAGSTRLVGAGAALASLVILVVPAVSSAHALDRLSLDPWREAQVWMAENLPDGARIATEPLAPHVDETRYEVLPSLTLGAHTLGWYQERDVDFFISSSELSDPALLNPASEFDRARALYQAILEDDCIVFRADGVHQTEAKDLEIVVSRMPPC